MEYGKDVNHTVEDMTALMLAANNGRLCSVCELLEWGADPYLKNEKAWVLAEREGHNAICLLLTNDKINANDLHGGIILLAATRNGNQKVSASLIQRGANVDQQNESGETALLVAARMKSEDVVKKILRHRLPKHDQRSIEKRVRSLVKYVDSDYFIPDVFQDEEVLNFYRRKDDDGVKFLEAIASLHLLREREQVIDILVTIDRCMFNSDKDKEDSKFRVMEQIKSAINSSAELSDMITSVKSRYPWSKYYKYFKIFISFSHLFLTLMFYSFDLYTDFKFGWDMDENSRNITQIQNKRFKSFTEWRVAAYISFIHCSLPIVSSIYIWAMLEWGEWSRSSFFRFPNPFFTQSYMFYCDCKLFNILARPDRDEDEERRQNYEEDKAMWEKKIDFYNNFVNLSKIIEATTESGFQGR